MRLPEDTNQRRRSFFISNKAMLSRAERPSDRSSFHPKKCQRGCRRTGASASPCQGPFECRPALQHLIFPVLIDLHVYPAILLCFPILVHYGSARGQMLNVTVLRKAKGLHLLHEGEVPGPGWLGSKVQLFVQQPGPYSHWRNPTRGNGDVPKGTAIVERLEGRGVNIGSDVAWTRVYPHNAKKARQDFPPNAEGCTKQIQEGGT